MNLRNQSTLLGIIPTFFIATFVNAANFILPQYGEISVPDGWELHSEHSSPPDQRIPFHYLSFTKNASLEYLTFFCIGKSGHSTDSIISWSDTAIELAPSGKPSMSLNEGIETSKTLAITIRSQVSTIIASNSFFETLEYSYITTFSELPPSKNLLSHGYVLFGDSTVVVQHSANFPISPSVALQCASKLQDGLAKISDPKNLKLLDTKN